MIAGLALGMMTGCNATEQSTASEQQSVSEKAQSKEESADMSTEQKTDYATFGGGCFWCVEAIYERIDGVSSAVSGYAGGESKNPTYKEVCSGTSGHAEVVRITYDPAKVKFETLLDVFFATHDPTTLNRQGNDVGTQYRSVIFCHDESQRNIATEKIKELTEKGTYSDPIVTQIEDDVPFYEAEDYHQDYFQLNPRQPYCQFVVAPKVKKFEKHKDELLGK